MKRLKNDLAVVVTFLLLLIVLKAIGMLMLTLIISLHLSLVIEMTSPMYSVPISVRVLMQRC